MLNHKKADRMSNKICHMFLHAGKAFTQKFSGQPTLPFYLKLSLNKAF